MSVQYNGHKASKTGAELQSRTGKKIFLLGGNFAERIWRATGTEMTDRLTKNSKTEAVDFASVRMKRK